MERIKLSVWITTYNHEAFIAQALDSVLMQQTDFDFEIVIGEDCSTDQTRAIVLRYKQNYPEKIRLFLPEKNLGMAKMFEATYALCQGEYLAWLDGDDYWTDPQKLQTQVDFLDQNPDFVLSSHSVKRLDLIKKTFLDHINELGLQGEVSTDLLIGNQNPFYAPSIVHRNILGSKLPDWIFSLPFLDLGIYFLLNEKGKMHYVDEVWATYRIHKNGNWSSLDNFEKSNAFRLFFDAILKHIDHFPKCNIYYHRIVKLIEKFKKEMIEYDFSERSFYRSKLNGLPIPIKYRFKLFLHLMKNK
ncbi:glycosyltransferase family 2 protein [Pararhodonellum marinum]|uniref:glycosyltransferase family 2 protein n=1 Tax=Pararhodonellum marinum TaxID=2755358 RepID=UPI00188E657C|nr:glycosyltransferase [Pararhodonellum marinum]